MRTCLIQQAWGKYLPYQLKTFPVHADYCSLYGMDYLTYCGEIIGDHKHGGNWWRIKLILDAFSYGNELVVWMDTDSLIVDFSVDIRDAAKEFKHIGMCRHTLPWEGRDWHYNAGVSFYRRNPRVINFLNNVWDIGELNDPYQWHEQHVMMLIDRGYPIIQRIGNKWNSTPDMNVAPNPIIKSWHGHWDMFVKEIEGEIANANH